MSLFLWWRHAHYNINNGKYMDRQQSWIDIIVMLDLKTTTSEFQENVDRKWWHSGGTQCYSCPACAEDQLIIAMVHIGSSSVSENVTFSARRWSRSIFNKIYLGSFFQKANLVSLRCQFSSVHSCNLQHSHLILLLHCNDIYVKKKTWKHWRWVFTYF